jgi:hypothetical protein
MHIIAGGEAQNIASGGIPQANFEDDRHGLQDKILGMLKSDPSLYQALKGIDPTSGMPPQGLRPGGLPPPDKLLGIFQDKQSSLGLNKVPQRKDVADMSAQRFGPGPAGNSLLGDPPSRISSGPIGGPSGGQDFQAMQDKIMDMFQGRDSKPSAGQGSSSAYSRDAEQYMNMQPTEFGQTRSGYGNESGVRPSERPGLLGNPMQRSDFSESRYQNEQEKPGILGNPYSGDGMPSNGRSNYRPPGDFPRGHQPGNASQFAGGSGGAFNMPPPGFGDVPKPTFRDSVYPTRQESSAPSQMQTTPTPDWMQKQQVPPQRYSRSDDSEINCAVETGCRSHCLLQLERL